MRRAAAHHKLRLESPHQRARAQRSAEDPSAAPVGQRQARPDLPTENAQQTRRPGRGRSTRGLLEGRVRPSVRPTEGLIVIHERAPAGAPLHLWVSRRVAPVLAGGGEHRNLPAQPRQVLRDPRPAQATHGAIGREVIGDDQQSRGVARHGRLAAGHADRAGRRPAPRPCAPH